MIALQYQIPSWLEEKRVIDKTLELPVGGTTFYFDIPSNPMVYVSETNGIIYINGSSYWESQLYMLEDLKSEFIYQVLELSKSTGKNVSEINDVLLDSDSKKHLEKRKFYIKIGENGEIGFYYNLYLPDGIRNGIIEIIPYYKQR